MTPRVHLEAIGHVRSDLTDLSAAPKQGHEGAPGAWLVWKESVKEAAADLAVGDDVFVLTWLDRADRSILKVHPRDDRTIALTGVFSTRSQDRPNPIGLHRARVVAIAEGSIRVEPIEAVDGTPVVDVKPVIAQDIAPADADPT